MDKQKKDRQQEQEKNNEQNSVLDKNYLIAVDGLHLPFNEFIDRA